MELPSSNEIKELQKHQKHFENEVKPYLWGMDYIFGYEQLNKTLNILKNDGYIYCPYISERVKDIKKESELYLEYGNLKTYMRSFVYVLGQDSTSQEALENLVNANIDAMKDLKIFMEKVLDPKDITRIRANFRKQKSRKTNRVAKHETSEQHNYKLGNIAQTLGLTKREVMEKLIDEKMEQIRNNNFNMD